MKRVLSLVSVWLVFAGLFWLYFLRRIPSSTKEWLLLLLGGPPAFFLASLIGEGIGEIYKRLPGVRHLHAFAERRTAGEEVSALRVLIHLATTLVAIGLVVVVAWLWRDA